MQLAEVIGRATATVKHPSLCGWRLLVAQPLGASGQEDGDPLVVVDHLGAGRHDRVIITSDGKYVSELLGARNSPVRWAVIGVADEQ